MIASHRLISEFVQRIGGIPVRNKRYRPADTTGVKAKRETFIRIIRRGYVNCVPAADMPENAARPILATVMLPYYASFGYNLNALLVVPYMIWINNAKIGSPKITD